MARTTSDLTQKATRIRAEIVRQVIAGMYHSNLDAELGEARWGKPASGDVHESAPQSGRPAESALGTYWPIYEPAVRLLEEASIEPIRSAFITRALSAIAHMAAEIPDSLLSQAVAAPSDYQTLLRAFELAMLSGKPAEEAEDLRAQARLRGVRSRNRLLTAEGGTLSSKEVAEHLDISRQAVDERRKKGKLIGLKVGKRGYEYPAWQFDQQGTLSGLESVLDGLEGVAPWGKAAFMLNQNMLLQNQTPLASLRRGTLDDVIEAARAYGPDVSP
jgi:biotin operon repressor